MDLSTTYLGLKLGNPFVVGASPLADSEQLAHLAEDSGAAAIVMRSLFEEQIYLDELTRARPQIAQGLPAADESDPCYPPLSDYQLSPDKYLRQINSLKKSLTVPVIASLNGCRPGGWVDYARRFESAGANAIEINLYQISADPKMSALDIEAEMIETVRLVKTSVKIPVAVKLSPSHTALSHFSHQLEQIGADGIVLFNRFYQTEFASDDLESVPALRLSDSTELLERLRWIAILSPHMHCSLAVSGGVHGSRDAIKAILAGAHAVQVVSAILKNGPRYLATMTEGLQQWMSSHQYQQIGQFRGKMNLDRCPDAVAFERGSYQRVLQSWTV